MEEITISKMEEQTEQTESNNIESILNQYISIRWYR